MLQNVANIALQIWGKFVYFCITRGNCYHIWAYLRKDVVTISVRNTKVYKICHFCKAIFSTFYNISQPNFYNFTNFGMFFLAVVFYSLLVA